MNSDLSILWLSVSPHLKCFDQRLLSKLVKFGPIRRWEYLQTLDEPCCIESVVEMLHEYISDRISLEKSASANQSVTPSTVHPSHKLHLIGHGVSGVVGLLYAQRYPQHVASLTLLSVNALPAVNWQAHYYALRQLLPCSRAMILAQMTRLLFGKQPIRLSRALSELLARDLDSSLTLHSLAKQTIINTEPVEVPVLVCNGEADDITRVRGEHQWQPWLKPQDRLWLCPGGNHFFHFQQPTVVANRIMDYWQQLTVTTSATPPITHPCSSQVERDSTKTTLSLEIKQALK
ncbi:MAG: alpha/beta hydrolase [Cyanobacteria bacterium P01_A01_bin.116]